MKKIWITLLACIFTTCLLAGGYENPSYIKADGKVYFGSEIRTGLFKTRITHADGTSTKFSNGTIEAMLNKGKAYELLPVVGKKNKVVCHALMEFVAAKNGLRLYRYNCYSEHCDLANGIIDKAHPQSIFYVFKDGKFHLLVDSDNAASILPFFGIEVIS